MGIELNIDEILVEGKGHVSEAQLRRAVEQELTRRFGKTGLPGGPSGPGNSRVNIDEINLTMGTKSGPSEMSRQIATEITGNDLIESFCGGDRAPRRGEPIKGFSKSAPLINNKEHK